MRKNHFRIVKIRKGEDTPCKECAVYLENGFDCTGNCSLIRRWKIKPLVVVINGKKYKTIYIDGYIYKKK